MKLYAPKYYNQFKCVADKCEHSCCIGWEIDIDENTLASYKKLDNPYAENILKSISFSDSPHFLLCERERCPHLNEKGLCEIILNVGEDYLCDICREHPRFYNYTDVAEVGLGMSCREAAKLILSSDEYDSYDEIGEIDTEEITLSFNGRVERERIYSILKSEGLEYSDKLDKIAQDYDVYSLEDEAWLEIISDLEYLDNSHKELFMSYSSKRGNNENDVYLERALAYFIYRHCTESIDIDDFRDKLSFCLFCNRLLCSLIESQNAKSLAEIAKLASIVSEEIEYSEDNTNRLTYL